jgi:hypothetical protein
VVRASDKRPIAARLAVVLVAVAAWLGVLPSARAATAEQCVEVLASYGEPPPASAEDDGPDWLCPVGEPHRVSDSEVPICLLEGASAVAPLPIRAIGEARIEASPRCPSVDGPHVRGAPEEPAPKLSPEAPAAAVLPESLPTLGGAASVDEVPTDGGVETAPRGFPSGIYRPPRG